MWEVWYGDEKIGEYEYLYLAFQAINGFGKPCEVRKVVQPSDWAGVTESVT